ncbi:MAG: DUF1294 domain-containing protein [Anaerolineae bacterium]|nr:DUF1294 domain-containing protein [Anaerolineae bacterium]
MYYLVFGLICAVIGSIFYLFFRVTLGWDFYPAWMATMTPVLFITYGIDKYLSRVGRFRVPELLLHILAVLGGFPGGWLGMQVFHHKTKHPEFRFVFGLGAVMHAALIYWQYARR